MTATEETPRKCQSGPGSGMQNHPATSQSVLSLLAKFSPRQCGSPLTKCTFCWFARLAFPDNDYQVDFESLRRKNIFPWQLPWRRCSSTAENLSSIVEPWALTASLRKLKNNGHLRTKSPNLQLSCLPEQSRIQISKKACSYSVLVMPVSKLILSLLLLAIIIYKEAQKYPFIFGK